MLPIQIGPFVCFEVLYCGERTAVLKARHPGHDGFDRMAVVKLLPSDGAVDLGAFQLGHPNLVRLLEHGVHDGVRYLAMEHLAGLDLARLLSARRLPVAVALHIAQEMCAGLACAHARHDNRQPAPVLHQEVEPSSVILGFEGSLKLIDFGILDAPSLRLGPQAARHLAYMAPERIAGLEVDARADVFSVGAVLHEMLTGFRLFEGRAPLETCRRVMAGVVTPPSRANLAVSRELDEVVARALARDPERRFAHGGELAEALAPLQSDPEAGQKLASLVCDCHGELGSDGAPVQLASAATVRQ